MLRRLNNYLVNLQQRKVDKRRKHYDDIHRAEGYKEPEFIKLSPKRTSNKTVSTLHHRNAGSGTTASSSSNVMANILYSSSITDTASYSNNCNTASDNTDSSPSCD
ncbi:hypothetical protein ACQKNX_22700 [Lysinibacillus sp. NPDC093712]|uniref:hypothetical protein n=1 Tax=Lysinibacillus sp. NPDC093712 TaxID=3390579 RepID=UPI003D023DBF